MLTQTQKDQLTQLMNDCPIPKLKKVLDEGLPRFISGEIEPIRQKLGVNLNSSNLYYSFERKCCLFGAFLIGKEKPLDCDLTQQELASVTSGFDGIRFSLLFHDKDVYDYVSKVRKVIFGC